jgi:membrane dipeptidase
MSVADMKNITIELLNRGYSNKDIAKIWGGNIMRVMKEAESLREAAL